MVTSSLSKYSGILYPAQLETPNLNKTIMVTSSSIIHSAALHASSNEASKLSYVSNDPVEAKILIAGVLALIVGILQTLVCHISFRRSYKVFVRFNCERVYHWCSFSCRCQPNSYFTRN